MKILFLWINKYKMYENTIIPLCSGYRIQKNGRASEISFDLEETIQLDNLLYGDNINVNAVVGQNGAGKSTLFEIIKIFLLKYYQDSFDEEMSGIMFIKEGKKINRISLNIPAENIVKLNDDPVEEFGGVINDIDTLLITYNNSYNLKDKNQQGIYSDIVKYDNIASDYLLCHSDNNSEKKIDYNMYIFKERLKQLEFLQSVYNDNILPFLPSYVTINYKMPFLVCFDEIIPPEKEWVLSIDNLLFKFIHIYIHESENPEKSFFRYLKIVVKWHSMCELYFNDSTDDFSVLFEKNFLKDKIEDIHTRICDSFLQDAVVVSYKDIFTKDIRCENFSETDSNKDLCSLIETIEEVLVINYFKENYQRSKKSRLTFQNYINEIAVKFISIIDNYEFNVSENDNFKYQKIYDFLNNDISEKAQNDNSLFSKTFIFFNTFDNKIFFENKCEFQDLIQLYEVFRNDGLEISFDLSTGEMNMISFLARIDTVINYPENQNCKSYILLLDEFENSFHPRWQQKILHVLCDFINQKYKDKQFHIILASHSPIMLSDIPKSNVIFLGNTDISSRAETFAANIASLYYDSFFMQEGSIGEVAKHNINRVINAIDSVKKNKSVDCKKEFVRIFYSIDSNQQLDDKETDDLLQKVNNFIEIIGEPLWRNKLKKEMKLLFTDEINKTDVINQLNKILQSNISDEEKIRKISGYISD